MSQTRTWFDVAYKSDVERVLQHLDSQIETLGSADAWCKQNGFSPAYVSQVRNGLKDPSSRLVSVLGFAKVKRIVQVSK